jgi:hemerythrin-like domain-containing protein
MRLEVYCENSAKRKGQDMKPTEILSSEHRVIELVIDCLEEMTNRAMTAGRLEKEPAEQAVAFIKGFADGCHHGKEEARLFPAMEAKGMPREGGPIGVMLHEHKVGRTHVQGMTLHLEKAAAGDGAALSAFASHARGYAELLRQHIMKEDQILFPMAERMMTDEDRTALLREFDHVEEHEMGAGTHERFLKIAESLAERYGISKERLLPHLSGEAGGCCHHK